MKAEFLLHAVVFFIISVSASPIFHRCASAASVVHVHAPAVVAVKDQNLIPGTCKHTPPYLYNLCVSTLSASSKSASADVTGLALIMVDALSAEASRTLQSINQMLRKGDYKALRQALGNCAGRYEVVLKADAPVAVEALTKGDPKFAENSANDAAVEANACEGGLGTKSPLTQSNKHLSDLALITASIVRLLL